MIKDVIAKILATSLAGLSASLLPSLSFGLGLGDIKVESRLNQALYARVEVVDVSEDDWSQVRARIASRTLSEGAVHPEILASLTLSAIENSNGRHFIEVKSAEVLTEPLFDLPVEVAGQSVQVVRRQLRRYDRHAANIDQDASDHHIAGCRDRQSHGAGRGAP
jgi:Tfp pilus assembly protein FimV